MIRAGHSRLRTLKRTLQNIPDKQDSGRQFYAAAFAALGDETRLALLAKLSVGDKLSLSQLTEGCALTRQAITKHLRVMERAKLVRCVRQGRESLYEMDPVPMQEMQEYLGHVSRQWDNTLARLKAFVEEKK